MNKDRSQRVARKTFLGTAALAASAAALAGCKKKEAGRGRRRIVYQVLTPDLYDYAGMMAKIRTTNPHKQLFPATAAEVQPAISSAHIFMHMQFALNGFDFSLPSKTRLATLGVFSGSAVVFALNEEMWRKYGIGSQFGLADTNVYYRATSNLDPSAAPDDPKGMYQDWSAQAVLKRGGSFMVCHHATTYFATDCALRHEKDPKSVLDEWMANMLPGFMIVPSGITAIQLAAENGWKIYPVG
ncbi:MAG: hypothetical protein M3Z41_10360 [Candidatus Eremiobacteraeota bacterium]|nr:hypothetical protein [Candidatus Eremiobacteraeota bacterium]